MFSVGRLLASGVALVFLLTVVFTAGAQEFSVMLRGPNTAVKSGSEAHVTATLSNTSTHEIRFAVGFGNHEFDYDVEVSNVQGGVPPLTPEFKHLSEHPSSWWGSYATYVLKPGESFDEDLVVTHLYKLEPGEYVVRVTRGIRAHDASGTHGVKSNAIHLTVTK
jgi:hypothetical protein